MSTMEHGVIDKQALPEMSISANCGDAAATGPGPEETRFVRVRKSGPGGEMEDRAEFGARKCVKLVVRESLVDWGQPHGGRRDQGANGVP